MTDQAQTQSGIYSDGRTRVRIILLGIWPRTYLSRVSEDGSAGDLPMKGYPPDVENRDGDIEVGSHQTQVLFKRVQLRLPVARAIDQYAAHLKSARCTDSTHAMLFRSR